MTKEQAAGVRAALTTPDGWQNLLDYVPEDNKFRKLAEDYVTSIRKYGKMKANQVPAQADVNIGPLQVYAHEIEKRSI